MIRLLFHGHAPQGRLLLFSQVLFGSVDDSSPWLARVSSICSLDVLAVIS